MDFLSLKKMKHFSTQENHVKRLVVILIEDFGNFQK